jgi:hypothetical protein
MVESRVPDLPRHSKLPHRGKARRVLLVTGARRGGWTPVTLLGGRCRESCDPFHVAAVGVHHEDLEEACSACSEEDVSVWRPERVVVVDGVVGEDLDRGAVDAGDCDLSFAVAIGIAS